MAASAAEPISADPWQIIHIAQEFGAAEVQRDGMKDPQIRAELDGEPYRIDFYGCDLGRECQAILFSARFSNDDWEADSLAELRHEWNQKKLFGRAWDDPDRKNGGEIMLDHPVTLGEGVSEAVLRAIFEQWRMALDEFMQEAADLFGLP